MSDTAPRHGYAFGTFAGVFTPSILSIVGVIMYLRFGWVLGELGLPLTLATVTLGSAITFATGLAISALATNMRVEGGGAYHLVSRSLGVEAGGAIGLPLFASQAISVSFYAAGFTEALRPVLAQQFGLAPDLRFLTAGTIVALGILSSISASLALRAQFGIMACIVLSLVSLAFGHPPDPATLELAEAAPAPGYWAVFAVFFPAVTGILSGVGMSGDLRDPARSIPRGTIAAVLVGWALYMAVPVLFAVRVPDAAALRGDGMVFAKCARVQSLVLLGMWAATLSSALGSLLAAPRTLQALARDRIVPRALGRGFGRGGDPVLASLFSLDLLAPVLTMINLTVYGTLNLAAALETAMGNPSWRPTFRVPAPVLFLGFAACLCVMLLIDARAALVASALVASIYWAVSRRALRARWGDLRDGAAASLVRLALRRLSRASAADRARNWRPNLLVFAADPARGGALLDFAADLSRNRSLATVATVLPERLWTPERAEELRALLARALDERRMDACVRVAEGTDLREGCAELVRSYGFGPLVPNTLLFGLPESPDGLADLAAIARLAAVRARNLAVLRAAEDAPALRPGGRVDVWWRGGFRNGGFLLALGWLLARPSERGGATLRLCRICDRDEEPAAAAAGLRGFLAEARVEAEVLVLPADTRPTIGRIADASADASLAILGLPPPPDTAAADSEDPYAATLAALAGSTASLPRVLFALAAEDIDFRGVFSA